MKKCIKIIVISSTALCFLQLEALAMEGGEDKKSPTAKTKPYSLYKDESLYQNVPVGGIIPFAGESAPEGWLMCDGEQYSNQKYPELHEIIKEKYVPQGSWIIEANKRSQFEKYFCVPDIKGRVIIGVDGKKERVTDNNLLGESGGEEKHQLTIDELARHGHKISLCSSPNGIISAMNAVGGVFCDNTIGLEGGDSPHNNMQPYIVLNYIINTGKVGNRAELNKQNEKVNQLEKQIEELKISKQSCAKAWAVFNGSATILNSYGVSSVVRNLVGEYTITFSKLFNSENYCSALNARGNNVTLTAACHYGFPQTRESFRVITYHFQSGTHTDAALVSAFFYGD